MFLLDESLPPIIADVLKQVGYPITGCREQELLGARDEDLIAWMGARNMVWVTKDDAAKARHGAAIRQARISVTWVRGLERRNRTTGRNNISVKELRRMLTDKLDDIEEIVSSSRSPRYFMLYLRNNGPTLRRYNALEEVQ